ncbi:MAG: histidine kinase, partial [Desulfovibrio sp.]|nr:histidine kinase [Desulfovibrio sp.]
VSAAEPRLTPRAWHIPVQTTGTSRGLLCLSWNEDQQASKGLASQADLARAIGQQLGIAMENLDALDGLLRQNATLSSIFEGIADPLLLLDAGGSVLLANSTAQLLAAGMLSAAANQPTLPTLIETATGGGGHGEFELPDGRIFEASLYPLESPGGRRHVAYLREVTAQRRMEGRMRQNERLVAVGQLAAGLAHEINNPLGVIQCYAELLRPALAEPQARTDLEVILRHTDQARRVVRDLLDFARPRLASPGPSDLASVAASIIEVLRPRARAVRAETSLKAQPDLPLVRAGTDALEHILSNLLMNALDAVPEGSGQVRLEIGAEADGRFVRLSMADNGPGIAPEHLDRVFDPFFTTKEVGKGTGLGLAVVYGLVRDLGGTLGVENAPGGGAVFIVRLPVAGAVAVAESEAGIDGEES